MAMTVDPFHPRPDDPPRVPPHRPGLGDLVAAIAQPIARAIDNVAGTDLQHCQACAQRKGWLNALTKSAAVAEPPSSTDH